MATGEKTYTWSEAVKIVNCSASTLRRRLNEEGSQMGATKLKHGWVIPHVTLEALGVIDVTRPAAAVTSADPHSASADVQHIKSLEHDVVQLRIEVARLHAENEGLRQLLSEREKVVALLESSQLQQQAKPSWWQRLFSTKN